MTFEEVVVGGIIVGTILMLAYGISLIVRAHQEGHRIDSGW